MRIVLLALLLDVTSTARADDACHIRVIKAPKRVRAAIEARAGIEASCTALDVRVVKRGKQYRVTGRRDDGQTFRGDARDAGRAAELVLRWAAPTEPVAADAAAGAAADVDDAEQPPMTPVTTVEESPLASGGEPTSIAARHARTASRDLGAGMLASASAYGVRAEVDVLAWRGFALGAMLGVNDARWTTGDIMDGAAIHARDVAGGVFVAKTLGHGTWRLRVQGGAGLVYTDYIANARTAPFAGLVSGSGTTRMVDASLAVSCAINAGWALQAGPLFQYYGQTFPLDANAQPRRGYEISGYLAIKKRL